MSVEQKGKPSGFPFFILKGLTIVQYHPPERPFFPNLDVFLKNAPIIIATTSFIMALLSWYAVTRTLESYYDSFYIDGRKITSSDYFMNFVSHHLMTPIGIGIALFLFGAGLFFHIITYNTYAKSFWVKNLQFVWFMSCPIYIVLFVTPFIFSYGGQVLAITDKMRFNNGEIFPVEIAMKDSNVSYSCVGILDNLAEFTLVVDFNAKPRLIPRRDIKYIQPMLETVSIDDIDDATKGTPLFERACPQWKESGRFYLKEHTSKISEFLFQFYKFILN